MPNYSAFSPKFDGCVATGKTEEEAFAEYLYALEFHLEGLEEDRKNEAFANYTKTFNIKIGRNINFYDVDNDRSIDIPGVDKSKLKKIKQIAF